jgi:hypothetical protein
MKKNVRFCWICGKKLWGNHSETLTIDNHPRTLHKTCAKKVKSEYDFKEDRGQYHSLIWSTGDDYGF